MRGFGLLLGVAGVAALGAVAYAATKKDDAPAGNLIPVWNPNTNQWEYAEVRPDGLYPTGVPAPPIGRPNNNPLP